MSESLATREQPFRLSEAAEALGLNYSALQRGCHRGEIKHQKLGKIYLIPADEVRQLAGIEPVKVGESG